MAVGANPVWALSSRRGMTAGDVVTVGQQDEPVKMVQNLNRAFRDNVNQNWITLIADNVETPSTGQKGLVLTASYATQTYGRIRVFGLNARARIHLYGSQVDVQLIWGGTQTNTLSRVSGTLGWSSSSIFDFTTASAQISAEGWLDFEIKARYTADPGWNLYYVIVEEVPPPTANLPSSGDSNKTAFFALDDEAWESPDQPMDDWQLQALDDVSQELLYWRSRATCSCFPFDAQRRSAFWRAYGPFTITPQPWATSLRVVLTAEIDDGIASGTEDVWVTAYSEDEEWGSLTVQTRVQRLELADGLTRLVFEGLKLRRTSYSLNAPPTRVWFAIRSEVAASSTSTVDIGFWTQTSPAKLFCERDSNLEANLGFPSWNWCGAGETDESVFEGEKGQLTSLTPSSFFDIAYVEGYDPAISSLSLESLRVIMSPHPGTGKVNAPDFQTVWDTSSGSGVTTYQSQFSLHEHGLLIPHSVYLEAIPDDPTRRKNARGGQRPSAGHIAQSVNRIDFSNLHGTPQFYINHFGARNLIDKTSGGVGPVTNTRYGFWMFLGSNSGADTFDIPIPIAADPNQGEVSGLLAQSMFAQVDLLGFKMVNEDDFDTARVGIQLRGSVNGTEVETNVFCHQRDMGQSQGVTISDASLAWRSASYDPDSSPDALAEFAYRPQSTWPPESTRGLSPWQASAIAEVDLPTAYPAIVHLRLVNYGPNDPGAILIAINTSMIVIGGMRVWCGPRR